MKISFLFIFTLLITGCIPQHILIPDGYAGPTATISDSYSKSNKAHFYALTRVEGKNIKSSWANTRKGNYGQGSNFTPRMVTRELLPKRQQFKIEGYVFFPTDALMLFGDDLRVVAYFEFAPEAGEAYTVVGSLSETESKVWLEDSKGKKVTREFSKKH